MTTEVAFIVPISFWRCLCTNDTEYAVESKKMPLRARRTRQSVQSITRNTSKYKKLLQNSFIDINFNKLKTGCKRFVSF